MNSSEKQELYDSIIKLCNKLTIAKYLKNELKESLKSFHVHKLRNIINNITFLKKYLLFLNQENCKNIETLSKTTNSQDIKNNITYFYNKKHFTKEEKNIIEGIITTNRYKMITMMQGIKGLLLLTIDEICNASPTRIDISTFLLEKQIKKTHKKQECVLKKVWIC